jgi:hypothetical protein
MAAPEHVGSHNRQFVSRVLANPRTVRTKATYVHYALHSCTRHADARTSRFCLKEHQQHQICPMRGINNNCSLMSPKSFRKLTILVLHQRQGRKNVHLVTVASSQSVSPPRRGCCPFRVEQISGGYKVYKGCSLSASTCWISFLMRLSRECQSKHRQSLSYVLHIRQLI